MGFDYGKIKIHTFEVIVLFTIGVIVPGFLFLFIFKRDIFLTLDSYKLTLLAISISSPIFFINALIALTKAYPTLENAKDEKQYDIYIINVAKTGSFMSCFPLYTIVIIGYLRYWNLKEAVISLLILELAIVLFMFFRDVYKGFKLGKAKK